ncbi:MAG: transglycosylase domain-containing protein [Deltaproteobacteria bacterium]|nr:transglycosylase domain-containing protein [Deltaproteobacteria bacterium]
MSFLDRLSRRWLVAGVIAVSLLVTALVGVLVIYPRVGESMIRSKVTERLGTKLGREIRIGEVDVRVGHAVLHNLEIRGPNDGDTPLVHLKRIEIGFNPWRSLVGSVRLGAATIDGVTVTVRRDDTGRDNVGDLIERLREDGGADGQSASSTGGLRPTSMTVTRIKVLADDRITGTTALVDDGGATWKPGELVAQLRKVTATTINAPKAAAELIEIRKEGGRAPSITVAGGEIAVWPKLALSGIGGTIMANAAKPGEYTIELEGGYGGVPGKLWTAKGGLDPRAKVGSIDLVAAKFQLDRLAPLLEHSPVVDYASTSVDTKLRVELVGDIARFNGSFALSGLNVGHPMIAEKEVHDLDLSAKVEGSFDRKQRTLDITRGDILVRDLPLSITGRAAQASRLPAAPAPAEAPQRLGPGGLTELALRVVIPPIDCQRVLNAIPTEMAPYMAGYKLRGVFDTDVQVAINWADLAATKLTGHVGIRNCRVIDEPADSPKRLKEEFEHYVEVEKDQWISFMVGESNDDYVPLEDISPYLIKSIMSTEDSAFYHHRGFIVSEFRTALVKNLEAGRFRYGASSITMQFVKNVLLYRDKTLARKLQELFLTWHVENTLPKDRILEIYFNVIEYGPGLYGIGPATWHYFSKAPKDLNPVEAAFFSSILPSPKERYKQYCAGTLTKWTESKIARILGIMRKRDRLTEAEYEQAKLTPLLFAKDLTETEDECMKRVKKAIKNSRSTNPMKR